MSSSYLKFSPLARTIAYFVFRSGETTYDSIKGKFGKRRTEIGIKEIMSQNPTLLIFNPEKETYQPSAYLEMTIKTLRNFY